MSCGLDFEVGFGITRIFRISKKKEARQMRMTLRLPGISRPQKRDQTEIYNEKYFELFPKF